MNRSLALYLYLSVALCLLSACSPADEAGGQPGAGGKCPMSFTSTVADTRAVGGLTESTITSMGVFAYYTQGGNFNAATSTPNYMCNQKVAKNAGTGVWEYSPVMYWPAYATDKVSFFAYALYSDDIAANGDAIVLSAASDTGYPKLTYTSNTGQTDLLIAKPQMNKTSANGDIKFAFNHALTKVIIKIQCTNITSLPKVLKSLSITGYRKGTLSYISEGTDTNPFFAWTFADTEQVEQSLPNVSGTTLPGGVNDAAIEMAPFYVLPNDNPSVAPQLTISYAFTSEGVNKASTQYIELPETDRWTPGAAVTYLLSINLHTVTVSNVSWESMNLSVNSGSSNNIGWETGGSEIQDATVVTPGS